MPHPTPSLKLLVCAACTVLAAPAAFGQTFDAVRLLGAAPGTDLGVVGAAIVATTEYRGSDNRRTLLLPVLDYQWANGWFAGVTNGIGYNFSNSPQMQYGLRLTIDLGRNESRSSALRGMGDIDAKADAGAFFNYATPEGAFASSSLRYGSGNDGKGVVVDLGTGYSTALQPQWRLGLGAALTLVNAEYMQAFFGVTPAQSAASGYAIYTPGAGVRDVRANAALTYLIDRRMSVTTVLSASFLQGDASNSPLTRERNTITGVVGFAYTF